VVRRVGEHERSAVLCFSVQYCTTYCQVPTDLGAESEDVVGQVGEHKSSAGPHGVPQHHHPPVPPQAPQGLPVRRAPHVPRATPPYTPGCC